MKNKKTSVKKLSFPWLLALIASVRLALSAAGYWAACRNPALTYRLYTAKIYRWFTAPAKFLVSFFSFSVGELLLVLSVAAALFGLVFSLVRSLRRKNGKALRVYGAWVLSAALLIGGNFFVYGAPNYRSTSFQELSGLTVEKSDISALKETCLILGRKATVERAMLATDAEGIVTDKRTEREILSSADSGYQAASRDFPVLRGYLVNPKASGLFTELMCYEQVAGIFPIVFTESIVNANTPVYDLPHTACHELAHQLGFMREDEANFLGFLACIYSDDPLYRYSGYADCFIFAMNSLYSYDKEAWQEVWNDEGISYDIYRDAAKGAEMWESYRKKAEFVAEISGKANDAYLKSQNIPDGTHSYGRVVDLLIAYYRNSGEVT